ncbi:MAG: DNA topoisomerase IV subunit A [Alphaproteobacteria bacterium]
MPKTKQPPQPPQDDIKDALLAPALSERYLAYALSTITGRALPDVRDGLKPVHRRLLYAMRLLKLDPATGFKKCARVVGDVIGRFHPHGDQAVYEALVRLAQDFAARYPLVDGQGNFGNIDGDNAAAMRYTESRLTEVAQFLLEGIDEDTVDFRPTYDGEEEEPVVMPAGFPNLLANGSAGIAVGMATSVPPHNVAEICDAALHLIKHPNASIEKLVDIMPGPDFPTGGIVVEDRASMVEAYATGKGGFRTRAKWHKEEGNRGSYIIVITEIPYQVQKAKLIERLAELIESRKASLISDVRDESAEDVRIVIEPKTRAVDPILAMEQLFRLSDLESRFSLNMNVLDGGVVPRVMDLREVLQAYLDHRKIVLVRRSKYRLAKIEHRLEILDGLLIAYLNLDRVIEIIRYGDEPKQELMAEFELSEVQAEAILNMRLRSLRKLEEMEIKKEHKELKKQAKELKDLLKSDDLQWARIGEELREVRKAFGPKTPLGARRTGFDTAPEVEDVDPEAFIEKEPITVVCSAMGWIRSLKGHQPSDIELKFKEGDGPRFFLHAQTTDKLLLFGTNGKVFTLGCDKLPGGRGHGDSVRMMVDLGEDDMAALKIHEPGARVLVGADSGHGFLAAEDDLIATKKSGKQVLNVTAPVRAVVMAPVRGDHAAVLGENRRLLIFPLEQIPTMARGRGVILQRYNTGGLADACIFTFESGLVVLDGQGREKHFADVTDWLGNRGNAGWAPPKGFPKDVSFPS